MYIQMGIQLILEEAAAASPYHLTGKPLLPFRVVAGHVQRECLYKIPSLTPVCCLKGDSNHDRNRPSDGEDNYSYD